MKNSTFYLAPLAAIWRRRDAIAVYVLLVTLILHLLPSLPCNTLVSHHVRAVWIQYIEKALLQAWQDTFRMPKECFNALCIWLSNYTNLPETCSKTTLRHKMMMFLYLVCQGSTRRTTSYTLVDQQKLYTGQFLILTHIKKTKRTKVLVKILPCGPGRPSRIRLP